MRRPDKRAAGGTSGRSDAGSQLGEGMEAEPLVRKARAYLDALCSVSPNRRTGSSGNREATGFVTEMLRTWGYQIDAEPFACLDHERGEVSLACEGQDFEVCISPYSPGCDVSANLAVVSSVTELESADCMEQLLLLSGDICAEQLTPKNYPFYHVEEHQRIIALLEEKQPAAIITATGQQPDQVGALDPFPLIVDGDLEIPSVFCREVVGEELVRRQGERFRLQIEARRIPATASNVIARSSPGLRNKIVVTAHIDAYEDSPGASDNASGTVVLLLLAELLAGFHNGPVLEIAALNGEDHYSAAGQLDYLRRYADDFHRIALAINVDDVGYVHGRSAWSSYGCPSHIERLVRATFGKFRGLVEGESWYTGDHMVFVQRGVPTLAITAERLSDLMRMVTHTSRDTPELVDEVKLVEVAQALASLVRWLA